MTEPTMILHGKILGCDFEPEDGGQPFVMVGADDLGAVVPCNVVVVDADSYWNWAKQIETPGWRTRQAFETCQPTDIRITIDGRVSYLYSEAGPPHLENRTHRHDLRTEQGRADREAEGRRVRDLPQA